MKAISIFRRCAIAAAIGLGSSIASAAPIIVSLVPSAAHIDVGQQVTIEMRITGLADEILSAFDADLYFDPSVFSAFSTFFPFAPFGGAGNTYSATDFAASYVEMIGGSLLDDDTLAGLQLDSFMIASFTFTGNNDGFSLFNLGADLDFERNFVGRRFETLDLTVQGTCVAVGTGECVVNRVPEPAAYGLLGMASLLAAVGTRRRRDDKKSA